MEGNPQALTCATMPRKMMVSLSAGKRSWISCTLGVRCSATSQRYGFSHTSVRRYHTLARSPSPIASAVSARSRDDMRSKRFW